MMILCEMIKKPGSRWSIQGIISLPPPLPFPFSNPPFLLLTIYPLLYTLFPPSSPFPSTFHFPFIVLFPSISCRRSFILQSSFSAFPLYFYLPTILLFYAPFPSPAHPSFIPISFFLSMSFFLRPPSVPRSCFPLSFSFLSHHNLIPTMFSISVISFPFSCLLYPFPLLF